MAKIEDGNYLRTRIDNVLIMHSAFELAIDEIQMSFDGALLGSDPTCIAIIGESRTGKTRVLEHFESRYPQCRSEEGLCVPILHIKVHSKPTVKGLAEEMLHQIGDPLFDKGTENSKTIRLKKLIRGAGTKLIILDEFQHFIDQANRKVQHHVADWLKILVDDTCVGLVVAGLPSSINVIQSNEQLARRFMAPIELRRFDWGVSEEQVEFRQLLFSLQESLAPFDLPELDSEEMSFRMYLASGGLIGFVIKILRAATTLAIHTNTMSIDLGMLHKAQQRAILDKGVCCPAPFVNKLTVSPTTDVINATMMLGFQVDSEPSNSTGKQKAVGSKHKDLSTASVLSAS